MDVALHTDQENRIQRARQMAAAKLQTAPDWVTFYREVLGVHGVIDQLFPSMERRAAFEKTQEFAEIQKMLARLRERRGNQPQPDEPTRVITVRLPQSLHESLRHEAHNHRTSMNKLCISKLLQVVADELVPSDFQRKDAPHKQAAPHSTPTVVSSAVGPVQPPSGHQDHSGAPMGNSAAYTTYPRPNSTGGRPF